MIYIHVRILYVCPVMYVFYIVSSYTSFNSQLKGRGGGNSALLTLKHFNSKIQFFKKEKKNADKFYISRRLKKIARIY